MNKARVPVLAAALLAMMAASPPATAQPGETCNGKPVTVFLENGDRPTAGDDVILGTSIGEVINGRAGDDTICAGGGDDRVRGGSGNDWIDLGEGDDRASGGRDVDKILGGDGNDRIRGNQGPDHLRGQDGADHLTGGHGEDFLDGGPGDDHLVGNRGADTLFGGGDDDQLNGGKGSDACADSGSADTRRSCEADQLPALLQPNGLARVRFGTNADRAAARLVATMLAPDRDSGWLIAEPSNSDGDPQFPELRYMCWDIVDVGTCAIFQGDGEGERWLSAWEQGMNRDNEPSVAKPFLPRTPENFAVGQPAAEVAATPGITLRGGEGSMVLFEGLGYQGRLQGNFSPNGSPVLGDYIMCITAGDRPQPGFGDVCATGIRLP